MRLGSGSHPCRTPNKAFYNLHDLVAIDSFRQDPLRRQDEMDDSWETGWDEYM